MGGIFTSGEKIYRVVTFHKTGIFVSDELILVHSAHNATSNPLYAEPLKDGISLFILKDSTRKYVASIEKDASITLSDEPVILNQVRNANGSFSLQSGKLFLSARKPAGNFSFVPNLKGWERFFIVEERTANVAADNIFTLRTKHGTNVVLNGASTLVHKAASAVQNTDSKIFAHMTPDEFNLFVVKNNAVSYINKIDANGRVVLADAPSNLEVVRNILDGSITLKLGNQFLSARKQSDQFRPAPRNLAWEHLFLDKLNFYESGNTDVAVIVADTDSIDRAKARLNADKVNIRALIVDGVNDAALQSIKGADCFYLLAGYENAVDKQKEMSARLESQGIARRSIINIDLKMPLTQKWLANVQSAVENDFDFIATGELRTALGFDLNQIVNRHGINLAADGQDLRQSYLTAKHVLERNHSIKFVLIGLTPDSLSISEEFGRDCQYVFTDGGSSFAEKIFYPMMNIEPTIDPRASDSLEKLNTSNTTVPIELRESGLQQLEDYIQLCLEHGAKPVAILPPSTAEEYDAEGMNLLRHILRTLERSYDFKSIALSEMPLRYDDAGKINGNDVANASALLNFRLRECGVLPMSDMRFLNYDRIFALQPLLSNSEYDGMMDKILTSSFRDVYGA